MTGPAAIHRKRTCRTHAFERDLRPSACSLARRAGANRDKYAIFGHMEPVMRAAVKEAKKYRSRGGRTVLARVEPLVPASAPHEISVTVRHLRSERNEELRALYEKALASYRVRILDSI